MVSTRPHTICTLLIAAAVALATSDESSGGSDAMKGQENPMIGVRRIVFTGDSLTDGSAWPDWVVETLQVHGYPNLVMHNAGVAGDDSTRLRARYAADVLALKPDLVVFNIGTNDRVPPEQYRANLEEMVKRTRESGSRMVLMVPPAVRDPQRNARMRPYNDVVRELAKRYDCVLADTHTAFEQAAGAGKEMWGPDGVHHQIDGWRTMARCVLDALGCKAPLIEKTSLYPGSLMEWFISPPIAWKPAPSAMQWLTKPPDFDPVACRPGEYPPLPEIHEGFDPLAAGWRKFDREAEIRKTSWWQRCWLERGGVMPMGQEVVKGRPGCASGEAGAFALAIVRMDGETKTTMHVGGSFPYAVWLNGKLVWNGSFLHGYHPDADRFPVTLRKGENHVVAFTNWLVHVSLGEF